MPPRLIYLTLHIRMPTHKAHGLQIVQNCEALAAAGYTVELWVADRFNNADLRGIKDIWSHYGVAQNFALRRIPCVDLMPWLGQSNSGARLAFYVQMVTVLITMGLRLLFTRADVLYSRDEAIIALLGLLHRPAKIAYEPHSVRPSRWGIWLQQRAAHAAHFIFPVTQGLADDLVKQGADQQRITVAHDGIRAARFQDLPERAAARAQIGWDADSFIVGYMGRLHTMGMDKGVGLLIDALARVEGASLALVGGPDDMAEQLKGRWLAHGLPESRFLYAGQVKPDDVPLYLRSFDVCAMPFPWTQHFAYYMSPLKLFEYMAASGAIIASELPSVLEVLTHEETALLHPPSDQAAITRAVIRLRDDPALRQHLGENARRYALRQSTWKARAELIVAVLHS